MAPSSKPRDQDQEQGQDRENSIERTTDYEEFIGKLAEYHEKRGTFLDREPKVGPRHINLLRLYNRVVEEGGYDKVSDTKNNKLAWRRLAADFLPQSPHLTTQAFLIKTAYYKNLAAYEITHVYKREPPPKSILEDVSAKGGDLLTRTVENYFRPASREAERLRNGEDDSDMSDEEGDTGKTPREDKMEVDDPGSTGRVTRALRHAPPQRVLFQPEMSTRQTRQAAGHSSSSQSVTTNGVYGNGVGAIIANYEPRVPVPSTMKPVVTPSNNPEYFRNLRLKYSLNRKNRPPPPRGVMLPGTGFSGPNIYLRALHALRSKLPEEEAYALHHLVKISHERGDKYRFDQFPGLAEALIGKVIEVASLFQDVKWEVSYIEEDMDRPNVLNGLSSTKDLIRKIRTFEQLDFQDDLLPEETSKALGMINEAALIIRNMIMLHENAAWVSTIPSIKDMVVIVLNLPDHHTIVELQHYALEIVEQLTKFWTLGSEDSLYHSLIGQITSEDRGKIMTSLKALGRIAMNMETPNTLPGVPKKSLQAICDWLLVEDEELRSACLEFLYIFTGVTDNVEALVGEIDIESLVNQLVRLLQYGAVTYEERRPTTKSSKSSQPVDGAPRLSAGNIEQLVTLDEPERSSQWLKTCFEEDPTGEITQIQLWTAYNAAFQEVMGVSQLHKPLMPAKDFITNVSSTFTTASAQVIQSNGQPKYTIRGIRPRSIPIDPSTKRQYIRCCWHPPSLLNGHADSKHSTVKNECGEFTPGAGAMWNHVLLAHLKISFDDAGKWILDQNEDVKMENGSVLSAKKPTKFFCHWGGCTHFGPNGTESAFEAGQHIKTHLPDTSSLQSLHAKHNRTASNATVLTSSAQINHDNFQPQFGQPVGLGGLGMGGRYSNYNTNHNSYGDPGNRNGQHGSREPLPPPQPSPIFRYHNTQMDDTTHEPTGLPLASILVLRNLARQLGKLHPPATLDEVPDSPIRKRNRDDSPDHRRTTSGKKPRLSDAAREAQQRENEEFEREDREAEQSAGWVPRVFSPVKEQLYFVLAHNLSLKGYMVGLLKLISTGGG